MAHPAGAPAVSASSIPFEGPFAGQPPSSMFTGLHEGGTTVSGQDQIWTLPKARHSGPIVVSVWLLCSLTCLAFWAVVIAVMTRL
jgi:hypothetical protein